MARTDQEVSPLARAFAAFQQPTRMFGAATCFQGSEPCGTASAPQPTPPVPPARKAPPAVRAVQVTGLAPVRPEAWTSASGAFTIVADAEDFQPVSELVNVLNGKGLRVMPVVGLSASRHLEDVAQHGIDFAVVPANALEAKSDVRKAGGESIRYVARLYDEDLHVLASREITDLRELNGRTVNVGMPGSGSDIAARAVFDKLGITPVLTRHDDLNARQRLRSGEIDAALFLEPRPSRSAAEFGAEDRVHLVPVPHDLLDGAIYQPALLVASDYPGLVEKGAPVRTVSVANVLAVAEPPQRSGRYKRLSRFVREFYARVGQLHQPEHQPRWRDVDPAADVPGWTKFRPVQEVLKLRTASRGPEGPASAKRF